MAIKYSMRPSIAENPVDGGVKMAQSSTALNIDTKTLAQEIVRQGTTVRVADAEAVLDNLATALAALCARGESVKIAKFGFVTPRVKGTRNAAGEWVKEPKAYLTMRFDSALQRAFSANAVLEEVEAKENGPVIMQVTDASGAIDSVLTAGAFVGIEGKYLKFNPTRSDEGVYFIPTGTGETVKAAQILDNRYSRLTVGIPATLEAGGSYRIQVRARLNKCKNVTESSYKAVFTVA